MGDRCSSRLEHSPSEVEKHLSSDPLLRRWLGREMEQSRSESVEEVEFKAGAHGL